MSFWKFAFALIAVPLVVTGCSSEPGEAPLYAAAEERSFEAHIPPYWEAVETETQGVNEWLWTSGDTALGSEFVTVSVLSASDVPGTPEGRAEYMRLSAESVATRGGATLEDSSDIRTAGGVNGHVAVSTNPDNHSSMAVAVFVDDDGSAWRFVRQMAGTDIDGALSGQVEEFVSEFLVSVTFD